MKIQNIYLAMVMTTIAYFGHGQNEVDALRFSQTFFGGSARYAGMGGSFGALGADLSVISSNPAGLGRFSQNQTALSFDHISIHSNTNFTGTSADRKSNALRLSNLGVVFVTDQENKGNGWRNTQFTLAYNRLTDFNSNRYYEGVNYNSLLEVFAGQGTGMSVDDIFNNLPFTTALAWDTYALNDEFDLNGQPYFLPQLTNGDMYHKRAINTKGGISEYSMGFSGNYLNRLFIGGSINLQNTRYSESYSHNEELIEPNEDVTLRSFTYNWNHTSRGTGTNAKLGVIYSLTDDFRLGLAIHTPTLVRFKDKFTANMTSVHENETYSTEKGNIPKGEFNYRFSNPLRVIGSVGYVLLKRSAFNIDAELANYNWGKYRSSAEEMLLTSFVHENQLIRNAYRSVINWRMGAEIAVTPHFFLRGGYAFYPTAFDKTINNKGGNHNFYSLGTGFRLGRVFVDLAYRLHQTTMDYYAFNPSEIQNLVVINENKHQFILTVGLKF